MNSPENLILLYGEGGSGKSTLAMTAAKWMWKTHKKKTRVVGADGGGYKPFKPLMDVGVLSYWAIDQWDEQSVFLNLDLASKGWWPEDVENPTSPILPALREWRECPFCHGETEGLAKCAKCSKPIPAGTRLIRHFVPQNGFEEIGLVVFEGATAFGQLMLQRLRKINPDGGRVVRDGEFTIAGSGQQHYGDAQNYLGQFIANTRTLPIPVVMWTALELRGTDDYGKPVYGPAFPGKALTSRAIPWFTDVIHLDILPKKDTKGMPVKDANGMEQVVRKLFLAPHFPLDNPAYRFVAKTSVMGMPTVMDADMSLYFAAMAKAYAEAKADLS